MNAMTRAAAVGLYALAWGLLAVIAVAISGCDKAPHQGKAADGYVFGDPSFERSKLEVEVVLLQSTAALERAHKEALATRRGARVAAGRELAAFSILSEAGCTIYAIDPKVSYKPEFLGHELAHCIYGEWHD